MLQFRAVPAAGVMHTVAKLSSGIRRIGIMLISLIYHLHAHVLKAETRGCAGCWYNAYWRNYGMILDVTAKNAHGMLF